LGQDFLACANLRHHILESDPHQQSEFRDMKDAIGPLGKHDDLVPGLLQELAAPALPSYRLPLQGSCTSILRKIPSHERRWYTSVHLTCMKGNEMIDHLWFHALMLLGLLGLGMICYWLWLRRQVATDPAHRQLV